MYSFFLRIHLSVLFLRIRLPSKIYFFSLSLARPLRSFDTVALAFTLCAFILTSIGLEFVKNLSKKLERNVTGKVCVVRSRCSGESRLTVSNWLSRASVSIVRWHNLYNLKLKYVLFCRAKETKFNDNNNEKREKEDTR